MSLLSLIWGDFVPPGPPCCCRPWLPTLQAVCSWDHDSPAFMFCRDSVPPGPPELLWLVLEWPLYELPGRAAPAFAAGGAAAGDGAGDLAVSGEPDLSAVRGSRRRAAARDRVAARLLSPVGRPGGARGGGGREARDRGGDPVRAPLRKGPDRL